MSIKGYSTQKKSLKQLSGLTDHQSQTTSEFVTAQLTSSDRVALDTYSIGLARIHGIAKTAEANTTNKNRVIKSTSHGAMKGDVIRFEGGAANPYFEASILSTPDADTIVLAAELKNDIVTGDEFFILRALSQRFDQTGSVVTSSGPVQFVLDGSDVQVVQDTVTTANSKPLPTSYLNTSGVRVNLATEAKQDTTNTKLDTIHTDLETLHTDLGTLHTDIESTNTKLDSIDGKITTTANGMKVDVQSSVLPTGAATSANQTNGNQLTKITDGAGVVNTKQMGTALTSSDVGLVTNTVIHGLTTGGGGDYVGAKVTPAGALVSEVTGTVSVTGVATETTLNDIKTKLNASIAVTASSLPLPTGAATESTLSAMSAKLPATLGQKTKAESLSIAIASDQSINSVTPGKAIANAPIRNDYSTANVTTSAYVQLVASTTLQANEIEIFDSSGQTLVLAVGSAGSEVDQVHVFPGGNGRIPLLIPSGSRLAIKAVSATASVGELNINFYN